MSEAATIEVANGRPPREAWVGVMMRCGQGRVISPDWVPIADSRAELLERVRLKLGMDARFRGAFDGCNFYPLRVDDGLLVDERMRLDRRWS